MPPPLAKNKSFAMHGFGSRVEVIQIQLTHWAEFPDENSWVQNLTQAFKLHSFFAYPVTCDINSNSNSCMLCSYHLLPRGSTPGNPGEMVQFWYFSFPRGGEELFSFGNDEATWLWLDHGAMLTGLG